MQHSLPLGDHPVGILNYNFQAGYMSMDMASTDASRRPSNVTYPARPTHSDADWATVRKHTFAYPGPLKIEGSQSKTDDAVAQGIVQHGPIVVANVPSCTGAVKRLNFTIKVVPHGGVIIKKETILHLWSWESVSPNMIAHLWWKKAE